MITKTSLGTGAVLYVLVAYSLAACSSSSEPGGSAGTPGSAGNDAAGTSSAGTSSAGTSSAGTSSAGTSSAGTSSAGTSSAGQAGVGSISFGGDVGIGGSANGGTAAGGSGTAAGGAGTTAGGGGAVMAGGYPENTGAGCVATAGALKANPKLPDPFAMHDGTRISTKAQWECRRAEIRKDLETYEIGPKQEPATVAATLSGTTLTVKVSTSSGSITLSSTVSGSGSCVAIAMDGSSTLINGCTQIPFTSNQVVMQSQTSTQVQSDPFYKLYPSLWGKIGNYSAWAWGVSRLIDGIAQVKDQLKVDPTKIGVEGCSYAGKMALFSGALDERVALTVAEESGGGGIDSWRTSQDFTTRTGTAVEKIDNTNYGWFMSSMKSRDPYSLPHDHHELIAMIAPRAVVAMGNADYDWLGDESGYKSIMAAAEVFKAWGVPDNIGFDFTSGHPHCSAPASQFATAKAFVDRFLKGATTSTAITIKPTSTKFNLDYASEITWTTPTLQ